MNEKNFTPTDEQGLTVWQRLDACDRAILGLSAQVTELKTQYDAMQRKLSSVPFGSVGKLVETIEHIFDCKDGDHRWCHEVWVDDPKGTGYRQYPYTVLGAIAPASMPDAQERLRQALYTALHKLKRTCKSERPVLYWRHSGAERICEEEGVSNKVGSSHKIRVRLAIPEADFSVVPELIKTDAGEYQVLRG